MNVELLRSFNRPASGLFRTYDHLIAARLGMTLMVPVSITSGRLEPLVDHCPVPWIEATAILGVEHEKAAPLYLSDLITQVNRIRPGAQSPLAVFALDLIEAFASKNGIFHQDMNWRHAQIRLSPGCEPCRVLVGERGVRLAFVPDFLEGVL